jgi:hypothetical protein
MVARKVYIPDRSRPGLTTTATGTASQQGACGNYATNGNKKRDKEEVIRIGSLNVGTMTGRGRELVDVMIRRRIKAMCVQETKWTGNSSRQLGEGYKLIYSGENTRTNGVGVVVCPELADKVVKVERHSGRLLNVQIAYKNGIWNIISAYAPQVGRPQDEKDSFLDELEEVVGRIPENEMLVIGSDLNAHLGEKNCNYIEEHGQNGFGKTNAEGERVLETLQALKLFATNTSFKKNTEQLITYRSGGHDSQVDYILMRKENKFRVKDTKVLPFEAVTKQHRLLVTDIKKPLERKFVAMKRPPRTKLWKLKDNKKEYNREINDLRNKINNCEKTSCDAHWKEMSEILEIAAKKCCGQTRGGRPRENEAWWWKPEVQDKLKEKKVAYKCLKEGMGNLEQYKKIKKEAKVAVAIAKEEAWKDWYDNLDTKEGEDQIFKIARHRANQKKDIRSVPVIKDSTGIILTDEENIKKRWGSYFQELLNTENERKPLEEIKAVQGPIQNITPEEVAGVIKDMKTNKAPGPSGITTEHFKNLDDAGIKWLTALLNMIWYEEKIPEDWTKSNLITIYKEKGDPMDCKNYRGIKLLEHGLKIIEKILDKRLRQNIKIHRTQFGFSPGKGTTDAIFIIRQIQEKTLEKRKKLFVGFLDLEKAFDRVPREVMYWCLRKKGAPEKLIRLVQATYKNAATKVMTRHGDTEEFEITVGVHQGSALSPFLFIVVMDTLLEDVRTDVPWELLFADDVALISNSEEELQHKIKMFQNKLTDGGLKLNANKSEVLVMECEGNTQVTITDNNNIRLKQTDSFKYLGTELSKNSTSLDAVKQRVKAGWNKWREVTGIIFDKKIPRKLKCKIYKTVIRPVLMYGAECWTITKASEALLKRTEMRMLRCILQISLKDKIRNEEILKRCGVTVISEKVQEARLKWFGHILRRDEDEPCRLAWNLYIEGDRSRGRPRQRWSDNIRKDLKEKELNVRDVMDRVKWRHATKAADPRTVWDQGCSK